MCLNGIEQKTVKQHKLKEGKEAHAGRHENRSLLMQSRLGIEPARQRLGRLSTRASATQSSRPPTSNSSLPGGDRPASAAASASGRHVAAPKLSQEDSWAAELDNDDSWDSLDQKPSSGMCPQDHYD